MPRDGLEQGVGELLLLSGTVGVEQKKTMKDARGRVIKLCDRHR